MDQPSSHSFQHQFQHVPVLLKSIERKLDWGKSVQWTSADFENLSDHIFAITGERLSVTTLKRTWGRTSQEVKPSISTLNILSRFLGKASWREFVSTQLAEITEKDNSRFIILDKRVLSIVAGTLAIVMSAFFFVAYIISNHATTTPIDPAAISFSIDKVTTGIPNTVIFRYDLNGQSVDSLELQQSWDQRRRIRLNPSDSLVTAIYMKPGYFNAKLVVNGAIVHTDNLYLPSDGFQSMVSFTSSGLTQFISSEHWLLDNDGFRFQNDLEQLYPSQEIEDVILLNLLPSPIIDSDDFTARMDFTLKGDNNADPCHSTMLIITGSEQVYLFSMGAKGCSGVFSAQLAGTYVDGSKRDLSAMGLSTDEETEILIEKKGGILGIEVNGEYVQLGDKISSIGPIGGFRFFVSQDVEISTMTMSDRQQSFDFLHSMFIDPLLSTN